MSHGESLPLDPSSVSNAPKRSSRRVRDPDGESGSSSSDVDSLPRPRSAAEQRESQIPGKCQRIGHVRDQADRRNAGGAPSVRWAPRRVRRALSEPPRSVSRSVSGPPVLEESLQVWHRRRHPTMQKHDSCQSSWERDVALAVARDRQRVGLEAARHR